MPAFSMDTPGRSAKSLADITGEIRRSTGRVFAGGPEPYLHVAARRTGAKFDWALLDRAVSPHRVVASGKTWTRWGAYRAVFKAHNAELVERALNRPGARDRRDDGLGCE